jgi:nitroreductase
MEFNRPVSELVRERSSWRTYYRMPIEEETKARLLEYISSLSEGPFGASIRIHLVDMPDSPSWKTRILGTYGMISGGTHFLVGAVKKSEKDLEDYGYVFEKAILFATGLGLGTCWMGGTFSRSRFAEKIGQREGEVIPAISPVGYKKPKRGISDAITHRFARSSSRKPSSDLFFQGNFGTPITESIAHKYSTPLEMVRLAPSANNGQPWRIVKADQRNVFHFYIQRKRAYNKLPTADLQRIDMGIGMCHFELAATELGLSGNWETKVPPGESLPPRTEYLVSWAEQSAPDA